VSAGDYCKFIHTINKNHTRACWPFLHIKIRARVCYKFAIFSGMCQKQDSGGSDDAAELGIGNCHGHVMFC
jgi:hypothetical protein